MYQTYVGKSISDYIHGFKTRMKNHSTESKSEVLM